MSREEQEEERRFNQCVRKYEKIVKQFDELIQIMNARTKTPKRRRKVSSNSAGNTACSASSIQPDNNEVLVQTITRFLHELKADSTDPDGPTSTQD